MIVLATTDVIISTITMIIKNKKSRQNHTLCDLEPTCDLICGVLHHTKFYLTPKTFSLQCLLGEICSDIAPCIK